ncbi:hypothetical protein FACS1894155_01070 [Bacteroidia bacterium]|nr:hypothetical protein FACS189455_2380 [Bacteroidia bacterium]GHU87667.1 hypothetical protein FACS1894155_01070 [Bacteroidia bacterium]
MIRYSILFACLLLISCDSGDIYPEEKRIEEMKMSVNAVFHFENDEAFPQNYRIIWGAFVGTSPYPLVCEVVGKPTAKTWRAASLQTVPKGTTHMALALVEKNENKVKYVFKKFFPDNSSTEMNISETIDLATFERVQAQVFTPQCIQCHGAGGLAAGLDLTEGNAYSNLVGVPSNADNSPKNRVTKYNLQNSFLLDVLTTRPPTVTTNHTTLSTLDANDDVNLIRTWIMSENEE